MQKMQKRKCRQEYKIKNKIGCHLLVQKTKQSKNVKGQKYQKMVKIQKRTKIPTRHQLLIQNKEQKRKEYKKTQKEQKI